MISIIVASTNPTYLSNLKRNVAETIGMIEHEIIVFENQNGQKGLCEIYNHGNQQAKFEIVCFTHEDIQIKTNNWGQMVVDLFAANINLGLLGVAGSSYKSLAPSGWFCHGGLKKIHFANILQDFKYKARKSTHTYMNESNVSLAEVAVVDGVWFCSKKDLITQFPFDNKTFTGFHCYDLDISLNIGQHYKLAVTFDVLINHFSEGGYKKEWIYETLKLHKKWGDMLPINKTQLNRKEMRFCEKKAMRYFIYKMQQFEIPAIKRLAILWETKLYRTVGWSLFLKLAIVDVFRHRTYND